MNIPARLDCTLNGMLAIGTLPMVVFAVTLALPSRVRFARGVSVTASKSSCIAGSLSALKGRLWKLIGRSATFPVETPPTVSDVGKVNCQDVSWCSKGRENVTYGSDLGTIVR